MFCNACGTELQAGFNVCPKCGKPIGDPVSYVTRTRLQNHLHTLGTLWIVAGTFFLIPSVGMLFLSSVARFLIHDNPVARLFGPLALMLLGGSILLVAAGGILVGRGLRNREPWARTAAIVLAFWRSSIPPSAPPSASTPSGCSCPTTAGPNTAGWPAPRNAPLPAGHSLTTLLS